MLMYTLCSHQKRVSNELNLDLAHIGSWADEGPVARPGANMSDATASTSTSTGPSVSSLLKNYNDRHDVSPMVHVFLNESQNQSKLYADIGHGK
jgi:hypothetical protein